MKFDHDDKNFNFLHDNTHQISHPKTDKYGIYIPRSRESFKHKRNYKKLIMFIVILSEMLIVLLILLYVISPLNHVNRVTVKGNHTIVSQNIIKDIKAQPGDSVARLMIHHGYLENIAYKKNVQLKSINIKDHDWNHIVINVKEYPIIAYVNRNHKYYAMSDNGKYARQATRPSQVYPLMFNFKSSRILNVFTKSYKQIPTSIKLDISKIYYSPTNADPNRVHLYMGDGNQVYADLRDWSQKMKYYPAISKSMKKRGIVNLELSAYSKTFAKSKR